MEYLYLYIGGFLILVAGYMLGVRDERNNGPAACQKIMDAEIAEYYRQREEMENWDLESWFLDNEKASLRIREIK